MKEYTDAPLHGVIKIEKLSSRRGLDVAETYDPRTDICRVNPDVATIDTLYEGLYHRNQYEFLTANGFDFLQSPQVENFCADAAELGIIPRIRDIALEHGTLEIDGISNEYIRYFEYAASFARRYSSIDPTIRDTFINVVKGNKLFDGLAQVLLHITSGGDPMILALRRFNTDYDLELQDWKLINEARETW